MLPVYIEYYIQSRLYCYRVPTCPGKVPEFFHNDSPITVYLIKAVLFDQSCIIWSRWYYWIKVISIDQGCWSWSSCTIWWWLYYWKKVVLFLAGFTVTFVLLFLYEYCWMWKICMGNFSCWGCYWQFLRTLFICISVFGVLGVGIVRYVTGNMDLEEQSVCSGLLYIYLYILTYKNMWHFHLCQAVWS